MHEINVFSSEGGTLVAHAHGEVLLDTSDRTLTVYGDGAAHFVFNWNHILGYTQSPLVDDDHA